jgi:hypothetical protein
MEFVGPTGRVFPIPAGWAYKGRTRNDQGTIWQRVGATGNADSIRIVDASGADPRYPNGYLRYYNSLGQPLDVNGKPGDRASTHIPLDYIGPIPGWPK